MKHIGFLITGIVVTVLFFILSCGFDYNIYEWMYTSQGFSDSMMNLNVYPVIAAITIIVAWGGAAIYYYAINSVKFDRWYHWLAVMAAVAVLSPVICYLYNDSVFSDSGLAYAGQAMRFEMVTVLFAAVLFIIASYSIRWWSSNCRHTPIPQ
ncbi:MAG: hypothetical protein IKX18_03440 [Muribaculaceae bacterium]|nr:hypothetical protein [Muribaculaceae bacterium]MBR5685193.1 hypothetical protein [Muribaculaceae bacterium]